MAPTRMNRRPARIAATTDVLGHSHREAADTPIIDLIQEVQKLESAAELGIASVFSLGARFEPGPIFVERMVDLLPCENTLRALRLSGGQLKAFLEHSNRCSVEQRLSEGTLSGPGPGDSRPQLRPPFRARLGGRPLAPDGVAHHVAHARRPAGGQRRQLHAGDQQLPGLGWRRRVWGTIHPSDAYVCNWRLVIPDARRAP